MFTWLRNFFGRNGNEKGNGKIEKANLTCESRRMVIDLKRLNDELVDAVEATEKNALSCEVKASDSCL